MNQRSVVFILILALAILGASSACASSKARANAILTDGSAGAPALVHPMADNPNPPTSPVKLIFIHHSTGGNWLADVGEHDSAGGLGRALMNNNYYVSATNYGWMAAGDAIGDRTDIGNWWEWFRGPQRDAILAALYSETGQNFGEYGSWPRLASDPGGENEIIVFKSCFPNSHLGGNPTDPPTTGSNPLRGQDAWSEYHTVANAKGIYNDILEYLSTRQDKLFVVITAPPLLEDDMYQPTDAAHAANARAFNDWLVNEWLDGYSHDNVAVFDFYNVLTSNGGDPTTNDLGSETGNHHRWWNGSVQHIQTVSNNFAAYGIDGSGVGDGDSHPSGAGGQKAAAEFVPLLNIFYNRWKSGATPTPTLALTAPNGGENWTVGSAQQIRWTTTGTVAQVSLAYSTDGFATSHEIATSIPNAGSHDWTVPDDPSTSARVRVSSVLSPTTVYDDSDADFTISSTGVNTYTFHAVITPSNATPPIAYNWSPQPASGQGTASATYHWSAGVHDITLAATNCGGTFTATRTITVGAVSLGHWRFPTDASSSDVAAQQTMAFQDGVSPDASYAGTRDAILANDLAYNVNLGGVDRVETFFGPGEEYRRSLMRWDLSALPDDITISGATVELFPFAGSAENDMSIALHRVTREWTEGTGDDFYPDPSYTPDGATWLTATDGVAWTTPGGDYDATLLDQTTLPTGMEDVWVRLDATAAVRAWVEDAQPNYGLLLRPLSGDYTYYYYHSREATASDFRPRLVVTYTVGVPPTQPRLTLSAPTGSTRWPVSSTQQIRWTTTGTVAHVNLAYASGGVTTSIETDVVNTGSFNWTTPPTPTTAVRVRVESVVSPTTVYDVSDAFTLYEPGTVTSTIHLPLVVKNYAPQPICPYPLTGVAITGPGTPPSGDLVLPGDFTYLGAFRLPDDADRPRTFAYGGNAMTFNPSGDPSGPNDGFPGSLYVTGHDRLTYGELPDGSQVAELSIPVPVDSNNLGDLNYAGFTQGFRDVAAGFFTGLDEIPRIGMEYLDMPATGPKIHLAWGQHMQPLGAASHAWFDPNLSSPDMQGVWFVGDQNLNSVNGYMFGIPPSWADEHAEGRYLATGRFRDGGWSGMGPALFAYRPWLPDGSPPVSGTHLAETVLLLYERSDNTTNIEHCLDNYQHPDEWEGGAWLTTSAGETALLFAGTKGTGAKYWYGFVNPAGPQYPCVEEEMVGQFTMCRLADGTPCPAEDLTECAGHNDYRGWWSAAFDAQFILYDPADLAQVAVGETASWEPQPYASMDIDEYLFHNPAGIEGGMLGTGVQRRNRIGAVAYDRNNDLLYVLEQFADEAKPVIHVWRVQS